MIETKAMNFLLLNVALWMLAPDGMAVGSGISSSLVLDQDQPRARCKASKAFSLLQVDCSGRNFEAIPAKLDTDIQVMVMTFNRLTELPRGSFSRYTSLEYLYLGKNFIREITDDSVEELPYLQVLDLTRNLLEDLPSSLFQLPYLRKLYLSENILEDGTFNTEAKSPLEFLELTKNRLTKIPAIGPQPSLTSLNLSRNLISHISTDDVAPFCSLKSLDLTYNRIEFDLTTCDCYHFNSWIRIRNLNVTPSFPCNNDTFEACSRVSFSNETMASFEECLDVIKVQQAALKARSTWIIVASCISVLIVCALIGFYCIHKRNKKRNRKLKEEQRLAANNANTELLNCNLPEQLSVKTMHE